MAIPGDLITLKEAAKIAERAPHTVRTWMRNKAIKDHRLPSAPPRSPVMVSRAEVLAEAARRSIRPEKRPQEDENQTSNAQTENQSAVVAAMQNHIRSMEETINDARKDRDNWKQQADELQRINDNLRRDLKDSQTKAAKMERELNRGVAGLLMSRASKRVFG